MRILHLSLIIAIMSFLTACQTEMTATQEKRQEESEREEEWQDHLRRIEKKNRQRLKAEEEVSRAEFDEAQRLYVKANEAYRTGNYEAALPLFATLCARYGDTHERAGAEAHLRVGDCFMQLDQPNKAAFAYESAIKGYPEKSEEFLAYLKLAEAYMAAERYAKAFQAYYLARLLYKDKVADRNLDEKIQKARQLHIEKGAPPE